MASHMIPWTAEIWDTFWDEVIHQFEKEGNLDMVQKLHGMKTQFEIEVDQDEIRRILKKPPTFLSTPDNHD